MSLALFTAWKHAGSPWSVVSPLVQVLADLEAAYPGLVYGTLGDDAHMIATPAEDHTPYSQTGWPNPNPYPVVHAADVMNQAGVDCQALFDYWLPEAKAGRMPWLKYLIWQATLYSVRSTPAWKPQLNSGHFDHIHLSARTDYEHYQLGNWSPVPSQKGMDMPAFLKCTENGGYYYYGGSPAGVWLRSEGAVALALAGYHMIRSDIVTVSTLQEIRDSFGPIPGLDPSPIPPSSGITVAQARQISNDQIAASRITPPTS